MPKVPPQEAESSNRYNPYITKGISKSLLTPCRRVGLSRTKTPNSSNTTPNETSNVLNSSSLDTTPVTSRTEKSSQESKPNSDCVKTNRKKVFKCLIVDNDSDDDVTLSTLKATKSEVSKRPTTPKDVKNEDKTKKSKSNKTNAKDENLKVKNEKNNDDFIVDEKLKNSKANSTLKEISDNKTTKNNKTNEKPREFFKTDKDLKVKNICKNEDDFVIDENLGKAKTPKYNKASEKQAEINTKDEDLKARNMCRTQDIIFDKNPVSNSLLKEISNKNSTDEAQTELEVNVPKLRTYEGKKSKKLKRSLSLKKSASSHTDYDEFDDMILKDCCIDLSPIDEKLTINEPPLPTKIVSEIAYLEKQIQEKRTLVGDLKQAEIYRNLHDVDKLEQLTAQWKSGCISGLNDLLPHFKQHSNMDMETLLTSLGVPSHLITLSQNGELI